MRALTVAGVRSPFAPNRQACVSAAERPQAEIVVPECDRMALTKSRTPWARSRHGYVTFSGHIELTF